eukprot:969551-Prorocentrum_minimum.AAC.1
MAVWSPTCASLMSDSGSESLLPSPSAYANHVYHSAHGISNIPPVIRRIFPVDRLPLAGRQSTPGHTPGR